MIYYLLNTNDMCGYISDNAVISQIPEWYTFKLMTKYEDRWLIVGQLM